MPTAAKIAVMDIGSRRSKIGDFARVYNQLSV